MEVKTQGNLTVTKYRYNGLGMRLSWQYDNDGTAGFHTTNDYTFYFAYDTRWRVVATYRASDANPKEQFTYHNAGLDGSGGSSYIDKVIMRDRDANTAWATASADGVLEERRVFCQNWRGDVSAVITDTGKMVEWVKYSAYGIPFGLPCGDTDSDGDWDATDSAAIAGTLDARKDCNLDGTVSAADVTQANSITGGYQTLGRTVLTSAAVANRKGYAGYENDGAIWRLDHVRHRVFHKELGRWTQRDPVGYEEGMSLYEYVGGMAVVSTDPMGLQQLTTAAPCDCSICQLKFKLCAQAALHAFNGCALMCTGAYTVCVTGCAIGCIIGAPGPWVVPCLAGCYLGCTMGHALCVFGCDQIYKSDILKCQIDLLEFCPCLAHD